MNEEKVNMDNYIEENKGYFDKDSKIALFKMGYICKKVMDRMNSQESICFLKKVLNDMNMDKECIVKKVYPKLTYYNIEFNLGKEHLLFEISDIMINSHGFEELTFEEQKDIPVYFVVGMNLIRKFEDLVSLSEASVIFRKAESTLKGNIKNGKFIEGEDVKKFGNSWVFTMDSLKREYGKLEK